MVFFPEFDTFDALGLAQLVSQKTVSPEELLRAAIERIDSRNPALSAVVHTLYEEAQAAVQAGLPDGPFRGVPFLLKDLLADCAGTPLQCGSRLLQERISPADSELVKRVRAAGLVILGKTSTPEFGLNFVTDPLLTGPARNPWDLSRNAGGSSGGSAAAVAARMVPMAHGGDGGGSLRIPSAWCGTFGLKVSRGRNPSGALVIRIWQDMAVEHVITRSVRDSAAMLDRLAGPQPGFFPSLPLPANSWLDGLALPLRPLRIAFSTEPPFPTAVHPEWAEAAQKTASLCASLGHHVTEAAPPLPSRDVPLAFMIVMAAEMGMSIQLMMRMMGRDNPKTWRQQLESLTDLLCESSLHFTARDFAWAVHILECAAQKTAGFFAAHDMLLTPTLPGPAPLNGAFQPRGLAKTILACLRKFPVGVLLRRAANKMGQKTFSQIPFTPLYNISGQPAMSVPLWEDTHGMPIGVQFAAQLGDEMRLLQLAYALEQAQPWAQRVPGKAPRVECG